MKYLNSEEALRFLESSSRLGMRFGLSRINDLLKYLDCPQTQYRILHVAGTNGKGSTCAFAASILKEAGFLVGLYTSPHLIRVYERFQVAGIEITPQEFSEAISPIYNYAQKKSTEDLTYFEICTAAALWHFAQNKVDFAVIETGLGGRLDSTNAVQSQVTAITRIDLDHTAWLGNTLALVAQEKAGIFKSGARVVLGRQEPEALMPLREKAKKIGERPYIAGADFCLTSVGVDSQGLEILEFSQGNVCLPNLSLSLLGAHQIENAEVAIQSVHLLCPEIGEFFIREGLRKTRWPGRMEVVDKQPLTILDGAHNPNGARALVMAMRSLFPFYKVHLVFGALADKDVKGVMEIVFPVAEKVYLASPQCERAMELSSLHEQARLLKTEPVNCDSVAQAIELARQNASQNNNAVVLIAGSLFVIGEAKAYLEN